MIWLIGLVLSGYWVDFVWFWILANILSMGVCLYLTSNKNPNVIYYVIGYVYSLSMIVIKADKAGRDHVWGLVKSMGFL